MESEENLSREKQDSELNISLENSSSIKNLPQKPLEKLDCSLQFAGVATQPHGTM